MKKNPVSRILSVILAICMVVSLMPSVMATESADTVEILLLDTSDIHGQLYATDYTADVSASGTYRQGLTRVATYVKEMREQYPNVFLADTGDTVQGSPMTYYFAFEEHTMADPTVKAMRTMGYDMWVLGNHEFNYGMAVLNEQVDYAISESEGSESQITMSMANYLAAETNSDESKDWATWRGFEPYVIKEYDGVKVAIMGIGNPGIPMWDVPANWEGIYFANPVETYEHYEAEMLEKADLIVLMSHSGIDIEGDGTGYIRQLIETHDSVDLVFSGHEHRDGVTMIADKTGKEIPVVSPSTKCNKIGQALISYNKADGTYTIQAENVSMRNYAIDAELEAVLKPYEEATWNDYMLQPIGTASGDFSAAGLGDAPSAFMDLINRVQLAYAYDYNGQNTPDDPTDDTMAQLSISAPLTSGSAANIIPAGDIVLGDLFRLYRYENWFYQITMSGKEVKTWLEFAATNVNENGNASNLTYYDVIYGDGFYYEIDCTAPEGSRIVKMTYNGEDVTDDQIFTVVLNNYRYNGGGNYVAYLNEHGCEFIANDESRIIYSTQYDMIQGEDQGQARNMLANYIREKGTIDPDITSTWQIVQGSSDTVDILMMDTSDIHGQLYATDYTADVSASGTYRQGLTRVATYIKEMREQYPNVFLADTGDTIQGTPLTYYFAFEEDTMADPTVKALRTLGYDMWVLGNHEFNYGMKILTEQVDYAISESTETESQITLSMANYLAAETNSDESKDWATWRGFAPYIIKDYDGVKVAIMGIGNHGVPNWDVPANWEGIYFADPIETYEHYEAEMLEKADLIVLMSHSGVDVGDGTGRIRELISTHDSVDLVFSGHEHRDGVTMIADETGKEIPVISPSTKCAKIGQALISYNKADGSYTIDAKNVDMRNYAIDAELEAVLKPYEEKAWNEYMLQPIGTASGDFSAKGLGDAPSAFMDLINQVQLHYGYDYNGLNTPDDPSDDTMAQLSISAPLTSGSAENLIPAGDIVLGDMFRLYRYENWFYQITMTGKEVKTWLEFAATNINANGNASNLTYYDVIYGDGFYYEIDCTRPADSRVVRMTYNGVPVTDDQVFTVVLNNYRYNGGGNYVKYLNEHGCEFIANDESRIIYSTQYDMIQGEDQGQARNMLANYIREKGTIDPTITSTWKIVKGTPNTFEFAVVSTTDMHGRSTTKDVATQTEDDDSMLRAATVIKEIRAKYGDDMVLIDNGDTIQGNLVAQYAINKKPEVLNPMIELMIELGYDAWVMGNHEFNFNPDQRDTQAQFALESGITALAANITLTADGKNMFGADAKAGDPFYAPYIVKTLTDDYGRTVNVAVIGFGNPANATWDIASNYPNMQFSSLENPEGDLSYEFQKWIDYVNANEDVDVIVLSSHSGTGPATDPNLESQTQYATRNSAGADLVISGHDHTATVQTVQNKNGEELYIVNAGGTNVNLNTFTVTFAEDGSVADVAVAAENIALASVAGDAELAAKTEHWYEEAYAWASAPLGTFDNGWTAVKEQSEGKTNKDMVYSQTELLDFVHKGQIWASWQSYETEGIAGATVSIGSAVFAETSWNGPISFVPVDGTTISTLELSQLYRYSNNLLCAVDMTGEQLWNWMNCVADKYDLDENGNIYLNDSIYGTDTFYGVDYTIDLTRPYGKRLVAATYQGQDLKSYEGTIRCTLNSYRLSGGYGFFEATGLTEADCCWTASQYLGSDRAPVPTQLGEYVAHMGTVTPNDPVSHGVDSTWTILTERVYVNPFTDVQEEDFFYLPVLELVDLGIVKGTTETTFTPGRELTRAEWVTLLWRAAGEPAAENAVSFTDVQADDFFAPAFAWAAEMGIVQGVGGNMAAPYALVSREQMVTMLYRYSGDEAVVYDLSGYTDVNDVSYYAVDAFEWAVANGYINGMTATVLGPQGTANRAQAVTILYRYLFG